MAPRKSKHAQTRARQRGYRDSDIDFVIKHGTNVDDGSFLTDKDVQTRLVSLLRNADLLLLVVDLSGDPLEETDELLAELDRWGYRILGPNEEPDPEDHQVQKRGLLVANKLDVEDGEVALEFLQELHSHQFPVLGVSAATGQGLDALAEAIFSSMNIII